jgi:DNA processing protein
MEKNTLCQLALTRIHGIGPVSTKKLIEHFGDAASIFHADRKSLARTGLRDNLVDAVLNFTAWPSLEKDLSRMEHNGIRPLFFTDPDYPHRLQPVSNAPKLLFYQGPADLNADKVIAIAGTRQPTEYGKQMTAAIIRELARPGLLILSGLAFGIDAIAHTAAMKHQLPTIGVLGHSLDHIYPAEHLGLSRSMLRNGGLLTPFPPGTGPENFTFPYRNQLVAGLCDALIVIESDIQGGSMSAAKAAWKFNKKIFALPGRITDRQSHGCHHLIHQHHALPFLSARQLYAAMAWHWPAHLDDRDSHQPALPFYSSQRAPLRSIRRPVQYSKERSKPIQPGETLEQSTPSVLEQEQDPKTESLEQELIALLKDKPSLYFENFITLTRQPIPSISLALLNLEIKGAIRSLPGKRYRLPC